MAIRYLGYSGKKYSTRQRDINAFLMHGFYSIQAPRAHRYHTPVPQNKKATVNADAKMRQHYLFVQMICQKYPHMLKHARVVLVLDEQYGEQHFISRGENQL